MGFPRRGIGKVAYHGRIMCNWQGKAASMLAGEEIGCRQADRGGRDESRKSHASADGSNFSTRATRAEGCSPEVYLDRRLEALQIRESAVEHVLRAFSRRSGFLVRKLTYGHRLASFPRL